MYKFTKKESIFHGVISCITYLSLKALSKKINWNKCDKHKRYKFPCKQQLSYCKMITMRVITMIYKMVYLNNNNKQQYYWRINNKKVFQEYKSCLFFKTCLVNSKSSLVYFKVNKKGGYVTWVLYTKWDSYKFQFLYIFMYFDAIALLDVCVNKEKKEKKEEEVVYVYVIANAWCRHNQLATDNTCS